jgi:hypothetical protein
MKTRHEERIRTSLFEAEIIKNKEGNISLCTEEGVITDAIETMQALLMILKEAEKEGWLE